MEGQVIELAYALDTFYFLVMGAFVMWMAAGFSMLEAGLVRSKSTVEILTKNIIDTSMSLVMRNMNTVDSKTSVTVNRITNYRVIVVSLLLNVIIIFLLFKLFGMFLRRIN